jgi:hypothetical protein
VGSLFGLVELARGEELGIGSAVELVKTNKMGPEHIKFHLKKRKK